VAAALQEPSGRVSVRYTRPEALVPPLDMDRLLMETPYDEVLAALVLDTKLNLRFVRTGSRAEGARVALVNVEPLLEAGRNWDITLEWDAEGLSLAVRDQHDPDGPTLTGRWPTE
jgi:hypothetical protein